MSIYSDHSSSSSSTSSPTPPLSGGTHLPQPSAFSQEQRELLRSIIASNEVPVFYVRQSSDGTRALCVEPMSDFEKDAECMDAIKGRLPSVTKTKGGQTITRIFDHRIVGKELSRVHFSQQESVVVYNYFKSHLKAMRAEREACAEQLEHPSSSLLSRTMTAFSAKKRKENAVKAQELSNRIKELDIILNGLKSDNLMNRDRAEQNLSHLASLPEHQALKLVHDSFDALCQIYPEFPNRVNKIFELIAQYEEGSNSKYLDRQVGELLLSIFEKSLSGSDPLKPPIPIANASLRQSLLMYSMYSQWQGVLEILPPNVGEEPDRKSWNEYVNKLAPRLPFAIREFLGADTQNIPEKIAFIRSLTNTFPKESHYNRKAFFGNFEKIYINPLLEEISWKYFDQIERKAIAATENFPVQNTGSTPTVSLEVDFNNYGVRPIPETVKRDENGEIQSFQYIDIEGNQKECHPKVPLLEINGMIFSSYSGGDRDNHDVVATQELEGGRGFLVTLCDGCGLSRSATNAAQFITERITMTLPARLAEAGDAHSMLQAQFSAVQTAQQEMQSLGREDVGTTTLVQAAIKGDVLTGIIVGDTKLFVLRKRQEGGFECIDLSQSSVSRDPTDSGGRFVGSGERNGLDTSKVASPELSRIKAVSFHLRPGDIVLASSDGVADCFDPRILGEPDASRTLESNLTGVLNDLSSVPQEEILNKISDRVKTEIQKRTITSKILDLDGVDIGDPARDPKPGWGKPDNANMGLYYYRGPVTASSSNASSSSNG